MHQSYGLMNLVDTQEMPRTLGPQALLPDLRKLQILLVEDLPADALLIKIALDGTGIPYEISRLRRGSEVIPSLRMSHTFNPADLPDLILLDLGLPDTSGFEVLEEMAKLQPSLRAVPIVILTAHEHFDYLCKTDMLCIRSYVRKPCSSDEMREILLRLQGRPPAET